MEKQKFYLVAADALPEVFLRVAEAKRMLQVGEAATVGDAARQVGISRSAFYKYRDCVFAYDDKMTQQIVNFSVTLRDEAGVLSNVLTTLYSMRANILTVNQNIPVDGVAQVSLSLKMGEGMANPIDITHKISALQGVVEVRLLSGE